MVCSTPALQLRNNSFRIFSWTHRQETDWNRSPGDDKNSCKSSTVSRKCQTAVNNHNLAEPPSSYCLNIYLLWLMHVNFPKSGCRSNSVLHAVKHYRHYLFVSSWVYSSPSNLRVHPVQVMLMASARSHSCRQETLTVSTDKTDGHVSCTF